MLWGQQAPPARKPRSRAGSFLLLPVLGVRAQLCWPTPKGSAEPLHPCGSTATGSRCRELRPPPCTRPCTRLHPDPGGPESQDMVFARGRALLPRRIMPSEPSWLQALEHG